MVKKQKSIRQRNESKTLHESLKKHDLGYCEDQSDIDGLYYFLLRNLEEFEKLLLDKENFIDQVIKLKKIVESLFPNTEEFKMEWKRYRNTFVEHFVHAKTNKSDLDFIKNLFI